MSRHKLSTAHSVVSYIQMKFHPTIVRHVDRGYYKVKQLIKGSAQEVTVLGNIIPRYHPSNPNTRFM